MKILILSSLPKNTGCWWRTVYLAKSLGNHCEVELVSPFSKCLPFMLDVILSAPYNIYKVISTDANFIIGMKPFPNVALPLIIARFLRGKKVSVDVDDVDSGYFKNIKSKIILHLQKPFPRFFDIVTYHNDLLRDFIIKQFGVMPDRLYKLDQGVDLEVFEPRNAPVEKNSLFYMGHLDIASDLEFILKAVSIVQRKRSVDLVIAGGGATEKKFRKLAEQLGVKATFTGQLSNKMIAKELSRAGICLAYYAEKGVNRYRCSMKVREYLAMGKKVVCNDFGDLKNFREHTYQSSSEIGDYANKILEVFEKSDGRELHGRRYVRQNLDWKKIGRDFNNRISLIL